MSLSSTKRTLTYKPLKDSEIRPLRIQKRSGDKISCTLEYVELDKRLDYVALSYVWGDKTETEPILVNGATFHATINLYNALVQISGIHQQFENAWHFPEMNSLSGLMQSALIKEMWLRSQPKYLGWQIYTLMHTLRSSS